METLTVRETIEFAAIMKLKGPVHYRISRASKIIQQLGLEKCSETCVLIFQFYKYKFLDWRNFCEQRNFWGRKKKMFYWSRACFRP